MILKNIWKNPAPIGRLEYLKNWFMIVLVQLPFVLPSRILELYDSPEKPVSLGTVAFFGLFSLIGAILGVYLLVKNIFKRVHDFERGQKINKWKWGILGVFPIISIPVQIYLLSKRGKGSLVSQSTKKPRKTRARAKHKAKAA